MATLANWQHRTTVRPPSPKIQPVELSNSNRPPFPFNEIPSLSHSIKTLTYHVPPAIIYDILMMQCILCTAFIFDKYFWKVSTTKSRNSWQVMIRTALPLRSHWLDNRKSRDASEVKITTSVTNDCGRLKKLNIGGKAEHRKGDYEPKKRKDWCLCLKLWISNLPCIVLGLSFVLVCDRIRSENNNCCRWNFFEDKWIFFEERWIRVKDDPHNRSDSWV